VSDERAERCETCRFWLAVEDGTGLCRRRPPVVVPKAERLTNDVNSLSPETWAYDWCGEYKGVPSAAKDEWLAFLGDLDARTSHIVESEQVESLSQLCAMTETDLAGWRGLGVKTLVRIKSALARRGLCLRENKP
jgi:hypothetical protein